MRLKTILIALFCLTICTVCVLADTLRLKDGTVLEGKVIEQPDRYWIKLADGTSKTILKKDVLKLERGEAKPGKPIIATPSAAGAPKSGAPATPGAPGASAASGAAPAAGAAAAAGGSASFVSVKSKADRVDAPVQAVQLWENYIKSNPSATDLEAAKAELAGWEQKKKDNAEKIKGVWVGGVERKKIVKQAKNLVSEGVKKIEDGQSTVGFKKIEDALNLYPQSFEANFHLGLYYLKKSTINVRAQFDLASLDKAIKTLETASKIAPKSSSVWSNLAIGYSFKKKHREAIETAYKACLMHESKETVTNLIGALGNSPRGIAEQAWCKPIFDEAVLMAGRHGVQLGTSFYYLPPVEGEEIPGADSPAGSVWSGSGFFVTSDGYLITNHHVATGEPKTPIKPEITFRVRLDDGTEKPAELIAIDDAADIAVMKIQPDEPVTPLKIADYYPEQGWEALVLGYPATGESEHTMEISNGTVKSVHEADEHEVWFNLNTTHGNSGGPIVDASNNVIAILTAGRESFNMVITLGVSSQQIKTFLGKIGDKAPKVEWATKPSTMPPFSASNLTKSARSSTVLVIAVRSAD